MRVGQIVDLLEGAIGIEGEPRPLLEAIANCLQTGEGLLEIQALERAERNVGSIAKEIQRRVQTAEEQGKAALLSVVGSTASMVAGFCYVLQTDTPSIAEAKRQRGQVGALAAAIRALTFAEFERFGARVLKEIGASFSQITPHSGDQGIDFYGELSLGQYQSVPLPFVRLTHDVVLTFIGQAKHYPNRSLGPDVVRELVGAASLARTKTFSSDEADLFPGLHLKPFSPVVIFLFTTGSITRGAYHLAESAGVIARSGDQLSTFLADKGVGMLPSSGGMVFNYDEFRKWLEVR